MVEARVDAFFGELQRNPVIPAVRGSDSALRTALRGPHPAVFVLGGDIFRVLERVKVAGRRPPVFINVELVGGVSADASGLRYLSRQIEGVISTHRHVIELAREMELLPALAYPKVAAAYPELLERPVLAGGLLKSSEDISAILAAGAAGVSTSYQGLWRNT